MRAEPGPFATPRDAAARFARAARDASGDEQVGEARRRSGWRCASRRSGLARASARRRAAVNGSEAVPPRDGAPSPGGRTASRRPGRSARSRRSPGPETRGRDLDLDAGALPRRRRRVREKEMRVSRDRARLADQREVAGARAARRDDGVVAARLQLVGERLRARCRRTDIRSRWPFRLRSCRLNSAESRRAAAAA